MTVRWNNILTLVGGLVLLVYLVLVSSTSLLSDKAAFIGLVVFGVLYRIVVEQHAAMRFAWLRKESGNDVPVRQSFANRFIYIAYHVIWWIPIVLPSTKIIDYRTGFIAFLAITVIRAVASLYRNNVLTPEQGEYFPLRAP